MWRYLPFPGILTRIGWISKPKSACVCNWINEQLPTVRKPVQLTWDEIKWLEVHLRRRVPWVLVTPPLGPTTGPATLNSLRLGPDFSRDLDAEQPASWTGCGHAVSLSWVLYAGICR
jgi:hypothetical protein